MAAEGKTIEEQLWDSRPEKTDLVSVPCQFDRQEWVNVLTLARRRNQTFQEVIRYLARAIVTNPPPHWSKKDGSDSSEKRHDSTAPKGGKRVASKVRRVRSRKSDEAPKGGKRNPRRTR